MPGVYAEVGGGSGGEKPRLVKMSVLWRRALLISQPEVGSGFVFLVFCCLLVTDQPFIGSAVSLPSKQDARCSVSHLPRRAAWSPKNKEFCFIPHHSVSRGCFHHQILPRTCWWKRV